MTRRKAIKWLVTYKTRDGQEYTAKVESNKIEGAVFKACQDCSRKRRRWLKAIKAWPWDETDPLPGMRREAAAALQKPKRVRKTKQQKEQQEIEEQIKSELEEKAIKKTSELPFNK